MASYLGGFVFTARWGLLGVNVGTLSLILTTGAAMTTSPGLSGGRNFCCHVGDEGWTTSLFTASGLSYFPMSPALSSEKPEVALTLHFCYLLWIFWVMILLQPDGIQLPSWGNQRHHGFSLCLRLLLTAGESNSFWVILRKGPSAPSAILITTTMVGIFNPFSRSEDWLFWETLSHDTITIYCFNLLKD